MGYVLPITQYEYTSYQIRDIKKERATNVDKAYKVLLQIEQNKLDHNYKPKKSTVYHQKETPDPVSESEEERMDYLLASLLTGKGLNINEVT